MSTFRFLAIAGALVGVVTLIAVTLPGRWIEAGALPCPQYVATDVPLQITDYTESTIDVPDSMFFQELVFGPLNVGHTSDQDLDVRLVSPAGTSVLLFTGVGGAGDDFTGTILYDDASELIQDGVAPFAGDFQPMGRLADFIGENTEGTWTLQVDDLDPTANNGTLDGWALNFCFPSTPSGPSPTPVDTPTPTSVSPTDTATPVPPTETATPIPPTETATPIPPTETATPIPPTETATPIPPTETATPIPPTETATPIPPTETATPIPPTETATPIPPTETTTPVPPTETATEPKPTETAKPTATNTPKPDDEVTCSDADVNHSGRVNIVDLWLVRIGAKLDSWGFYIHWFDVDGDGDVDRTDIRHVYAHLGERCGRR